MRILSSKIDNKSQDKLSGLNVTFVEDFDELVSLAKHDEFDLILFHDSIHNLNLLRKSGIETPLIFLSGKTDPSYKAQCLTLGADDYLYVPFHPAELSARMQAIVRRANGHAHNYIRVGNLEINTTARRVSYGGNVLSLSMKQYQALELLAMKRGRKVTREHIMRNLYNDDSSAPDSKIVDIWICKLRKVLPEGMIKTIWGEGYMI